MRARCDLCDVFSHLDPFETTLFVCVACYKSLAERRRLGIPIYVNEVFA